MLCSQPSPVKIFVLGDGSLLDEGIGNLLTLYSQLSVTRITYTDENTLCGLVDFEQPSAIFISKFDALDIGRVVGSIFSGSSAFVRCVIVANIENSKLDVYRPATHAPAVTVCRKSIVINTKEELVDLVHKVSCYA